MGAMPIVRIFLAAWITCAVSGAELPRTLPVATVTGDHPLLPLRIPGYELRVLEARKPVVLSVGGSQTEASLPVFFYAPDPIRSAAQAPLQRARDTLSGLEKKETWTGAELQEVREALDQALRLLAINLPPSRPANSLPPGTQP